MAYNVNKNNNNLNIGHINIRSIVPKINDIKECISSNNFDILAVSETWLTHFMDDKVVSIDGFRLVRRDRGLGRGGGVLLYIRNTIKFSILNNFTSDFAEQVWIEFTISSVKTMVGVVYRPPGNVNINQFLDEFECNISKNLLMCANLVCLGDFNLNVLNLDSIYIQQFVSLLHTYNLTQIIDEPTRRGLNSATLIDLILCSNTDFLLSSGVAPYFRCIRSLSC